MTTLVHPSGAAVPDPGNRLARVLAGAADVLELYSQAAVRIACFIAVLATFIALVALVGTVFTREALGYSIFGAYEVAQFAFLWTIWMGVSLAVKRSAVTVITLVSHHGAPWWQRAVRTFSGVSLGVILVYSCYRATQFALGEGAPAGVTTALEVSWFYPIVSMTLGYYFITLHYAQAVTAGAARLAGQGRAGLRAALGGLVGGAAIAALVWLAMFAVIESGGEPLIAVGILFVALTLAGTPIVFMLLIVGVVAFLPSFLGLSLYPSPDPIIPFFTSQAQMGLTGGPELLVILMFLFVAEVMNGSGMSTRLIALAASLVAHFRGGMAYVAQLTSAAVSGISGSA
ncbi:MAG TPA: TRAP transporter large permease subunit, partial [Solirubrobacterales bacterium]|nr:TRAP transporter large permease subunit [Solirubrobacterales bacterium]